MILPYIVHLLILFSIYVIFAIALDFALGYSGLLNLGHVAFFGIGAYTSALLNSVGVPFLVAFLLGGLFAGIFSLFLVFVTKNLKGDYFALASLGFAFVVYSLLLNLTFLTRGPLGIAGITRPSIFGFFLNSNYLFIIFSGVVAYGSFYFLRKLVDSRFGKILEAMRDDELQLKILGKNTTKLKYWALGISAFFAGISGSLFAHYIGFIEPNNFYINELVLVLTIVIVGGIATLRGPVLAAGLIIFISEGMRFINLPSAIVGPGRQIIYSIVLILILMFKPRGIYGRVDLQ